MYKNPKRNAIAERFADHAMWCEQCYTVTGLVVQRDDQNAKKLCAYGRQLHAEDKAEAKKDKS